MDNNDKHHHVHHYYHYQANTSLGFRIMRFFVTIVVILASILCIAMLVKLIVMALFD